MENNVIPIPNEGEISLIALKVNPSVDNDTKIEADKIEFDSIKFRMNFIEAQPNALQSGIAGACAQGPSGEIPDSAAELCKYSSVDAMAQALGHFACEPQQQQNYEKQQGMPQWIQNQGNEPQNQQQQQQYPQPQNYQEQQQQEPRNDRRNFQANDRLPMRHQLDTRFSQQQPNNFGDDRFGRGMYNNLDDQPEMLLHNAQLIFKDQQQEGQKVYVATRLVQQPQQAPAEPTVSHYLCFPKQQQSSPVLAQQNFFSCYPTAINAKNPTPNEPQFTSIMSSNLYPNTQAQPQFILQPQSQAQARPQLLVQQSQPQLCHQLQLPSQPQINLQEQPTYGFQLQPQALLQQQPFQQPQPQLCHQLQLPSQPQINLQQQPTYGFQLQPQAHLQQQPFQQSQPQLQYQYQLQLQPQNQQPQPQYSIQLQPQPQFQSQLLLQPQPSQGQQFQQNLTVQYAPLINSAQVALPQGTQLITLQPQPAQVVINGPPAVYQVQARLPTVATEPNQPSTISYVINGTTYFYQI